MLSGSSEIRNWIMVSAMLEALRCEQCEYIPVYRTPAGTSMGLAFMSWCCGLVNGSGPTDGQCGESA